MRVLNTITKLTCIAALAAATLPTTLAQSAKKTLVIFIPFPANLSSSAVTDSPAFAAAAGTGLVNVFSNWTNEVPNGSYPSIYGVLSEFDIPYTIYSVDTTNTTGDVSNLVPGFSLENVTTPSGAAVNISEHIKPLLSSTGTDLFDQDLLHNSTSLFNFIDGTGYLTASEITTALTALVTTPSVVPITDYGVIGVFVTPEGSPITTVPTVYAGNLTVANPGAGFNQASLGATFLALLNATEFDESFADATAIEAH